MKNIRLMAAALTGGDGVQLQLQTDGSNTAATFLQLACAVTGPGTFKVTIYNREPVNAVNGTVKYHYRIGKSA